MNADFISSSIAIGIRLPELGGGAGGIAPSALMFGFLPGLALCHRSGEVHRARSGAGPCDVIVGKGGGEGAVLAVGARQRERLAVPSVRDGGVGGIGSAAALRGADLGRMLIRAEVEVPVAVVIGGEGARSPGVDVEELAHVAPVLGLGGRPADDLARARGDEGPVSEQAGAPAVLLVALVTLGASR